MNYKVIIRLMRHDQWVKNLFVFLPLFFNANIMNIDQAMFCVYAFAGFSFGNP
ncbi:MAG: hypothetical protein LBG80_06340 [Bacteroidales bacterium]|nr:hypothetical protein [Bacteroidales bacterium]